MNENIGIKSVLAGSVLAPAVFMAAFFSCMIIGGTLLGFAAAFYPQVNVLPFSSTFFLFFPAIVWFVAMFSVACIFFMNRKRHWVMYSAFIAVLSSCAFWVLAWSLWLLAILSTPFFAAD